MGNSKAVACRPPLDKINQAMSGSERNLIVIAGLSNCGKTTILRQLNVGKFEDVIPTIGMNCEKLEYKNLTLWTYVEVFASFADSNSFALFFVDTNY